EAGASAPTGFDKSARALPLNPAAAHLLAWYCPQEKTFFDVRLNLFRQAVADFVAARAASRASRAASRAALRAASSVSLSGNARKPRAATKSDASSSSKGTRG